MVYKGIVKGGVVVLLDDATLAEGTEVLVEPLEQDSVESLRTALLDLAGTVEGLPSDLAERHNHYIHGTLEG